MAERGAWARAWGRVWVVVVLGWPGVGWAAGAPEPLAVQLSDVRQAQFAGYYVAQAKGYYAAVGLAVTLWPGVAAADGGAFVAPVGRRPDAWSLWMPQALGARVDGAGLVNFAQMFPHSGLELVCRKQAVHSPADLKGKTVAVWQDDARIVFMAWMERLHLSVPGDVAMLAVGRDGSGGGAGAALVARRADCVTALNYDQYWQVLDAGLTPDALQIFHYGDQGVATLQDGLYASAAALADPAMADRLTRFLRASIKGWSYAVGHQAEAVDIVLGSGGAGAGARLRQTRMMSAVARLTESGLQPMGWLEPAAYDRTGQLVAHAGGGPRDGGASGGGAGWTHAIWLRAWKRKEADKRPNG